MRGRPAAAWALVALLSGCAPAGRRTTYDKSKVDPAPVDGGTFVVPSIGDATYLNPLFASDSASSDICNLVYNGLIKYDKDIKIVPDLAESFQVEDGGHRITFKLRKNVTWQDGTPFTSADCLFTYQKLVDPKVRTPFAADYKIVTRADAPDPYTFRVYYDKPFSPALNSWGIGIIPKHVFETGDLNENPANRRPIGTGPYKFKEWISDEKIVLEANPTYFRGRPHFDRYVYRIIPDLSVQFLELRQGTWSQMEPTPDQYNGYDEFFIDYDKYHYPAFRYDFIGFNLKNPFFEDVRVRRALAMSINKKEIIDAVYQGYAVPATGPFPPTSWANDPAVKDIGYDPEGAKKLLAEAGWKDSDGDGILDKNGKPFSFTLVTNQGNKVREIIAQVAQNDFARIGVKCQVRILEWSVFIHKYIDQKEFEAVLLAWDLGLDPDAYTIWNSKQTGEGEYNFVSYSNPEVDALLDEGRHTFGTDKRAPIYHKIHRLIAADVPYIFLVVPETLPVIHKSIMGVEQAPLGLGWNFEQWWIPKEWQKRNRLAS